MGSPETPTNSAHGHNAHAALRLISKGLSCLQSAGLDQLSDQELRVLVSGLEVEARRVGSLQVDLVDEIDRRRLHHADGHASAKIMIRHVCRLSTTEAARRARIAKANPELPMLAEAYRRGEIGDDQIDLVARVHANPRVREALVGFQADALRLAGSYSYREFELSVRSWERLADTDGAEPRNSVNHRNRGLSLRQDQFDLSWRLEGSFAALQGSAIETVLRHFVQIEWERDWAEAKASHGPDVSEADLPRTHAQRMADAFEHICERAAAASPNAPGLDVVHNIVWSEETFFATVHRISCDDSACTAPGHANPNRWYDPSTYSCETIDGVPLEPVEAALSAFGASIRRVVVNAKGVTIDLGRKVRLFTGSARQAIQFHSTTCQWPGCWVPTTACEIDHIDPYGQGGPTSPHNGVPLCGRHNRWKQKGFTTWRDPSGRWHVTRPDNTEIT
jgi:Domain of unknown function (DUF222)